MNALELIETIRDDKPFSCDEVTAMLRAQHEAIRVLRDGLHQVSLASQCSMSSQRECGTIARKALAATEKL